VAVPTGHGISGLHSSSRAPLDRETRDTARALLLTVLGEFVLPAGGEAWTSSLLAALDPLHVEEKAARQAISRTAAQHWIVSERRGRQALWRLTAQGRELLVRGTARIFAFNAVNPPWDGRVLLLLVSVPEERRQLRHHMRIQLEWAGFGSPSPGVWMSLHPDREIEAAAVLKRLELGEAVSFTARVGEIGDLGELLRRAWSLETIDAQYKVFTLAVRSWRPRTPREVFSAQIRLVHLWRRFPLIDPGLPRMLLPRGWSGDGATGLFRTRHAEWEPMARDYWQELQSKPGAASV
jgi:phenylacetic acid degradation operon negative regulatory protein